MFSTRYRLHIEELIRQHQEESGATPHEAFPEGAGEDEAPPPSSAASVSSRDSREDSLEEQLMGLDDIPHSLSDASMSPGLYATDDDGSAVPELPCDPAPAAVHEKQG